MPSIKAHRQVHDGAMEEARRGGEEEEGGAPGMVHANVGHKVTLITLS
jgi:hypothetical protein